MNFINALILASRGFSIRRKIWPVNAAIILLEDKFYWVGRANVATGQECKILGLDLGLDLQKEDLQATDWE